MPRVSDLFDEPDPPPQSLEYADWAVVRVYDNAARAKTARTLLGVYCGLLAVGFVFALAWLPFNPFVGGQTVATPATLRSLGAVQLALFILNAVVAFAALVLFVVSVIFYLMWQHRAVANARAVGRATRHSPGWGVGWWFVPAANLFVPRRVLRDLWRASGAAERRDAPGGRPGTVYGLWLAFNGLQIAAITCNVTAAVAMMGQQLAQIRQAVAAAAAAGPAATRPVFTPLSPAALGYGGVVTAGVILGFAAGLLGIGFWFALRRYVATVQESQAGGGE